MDVMYPDSFGYPLILNLGFVMRPRCFFLVRISLTGNVQGKIC